MDGASTRDVLVEFSMSPLDKGESLSPYVARILDLIDRSGLDYRFTPMGTLLEGTYAEVMGVIAECFAALQADCGRISCAIRVDYRRGRSGRLSAKVKSVEEKVGRPLRHS